MNDTKIQGLQYLVLITEQKKKNFFLSLLGKNGAHGIEVVYGHGSMSPNALFAAFGLEAELGKAMITCLMKSADAERLIALLRSEHKFDKPNTGIAFTVPVEGLAF